MTRLRWLGWLAVYAALCAVAFVVAQFKEAVEKRIKEPPVPPPAE